MEVVGHNIWSNRNLKVLIQNPGNTNAIRYAVTLLDYGLKSQIPNSKYNNTDLDRKLFIYKHMIWIVESNRLNTIYIRNNISEPWHCKAGSIDQARGYYDVHLEYEDTLTFNYWNFPPKTFDVLNYPLHNNDLLY